MKSENDISTFELFLQGLTQIWSPGEQALKLQKELNVRSLEETAEAAEQIGCEVCYVDLPDKVSGFAAVIEEKPHIVLNRAKSPQDLEYTLPHELGHFVLHLNPSRGACQTGFPDIGTAEFQAHVFAAMWVNLLGNDRQRAELFAENSESSAVVAMCLFLTLALVVIAILVHVCSKVLHSQHLTLVEAK